MALLINIEQKTYSVNLADRNQSYQQINIGSVIHLPVQKKLFGLVKQTPKGKFEFQVELVDGGELTFSSTEKPFLLSVQGVEWDSGNSFGRFERCANVFKFQSECGD